MPAAPVLRHYSLNYVTTGTWVAVTPVLATTRALVCSKITAVAANGSNSFAVVFDLAVSPDAGADQAGKIINELTLNSIGGEQWSESGIVIPGGKRLWLWLQSTTQAGSGINITVSGQEVDN